MNNDSENWMIRIYNKEGEIIEEWALYGRTEQEAFNESSADVARLMDDYDWTMTSFEKGGRAEFSTSFDPSTVG